MSRHHLLLAATVLVSTAAFHSDAWAAPDEGACCAMNTSRVDALMNPTKGSDEKFFTQGGGPPNIMFLVGNNDSMQEYARPLPQTGGIRGCLDLSLTSSIGAFFDRLSTDPTRNGSAYADPDPSFPGSGLDFFNPSEFYRSTRTRLHHSTNGNSNYRAYGLDSDFRGTAGTTSAATACNISGIGAVDQAVCVTCMSTAGWYRYDDDRWVLSGRMLNVNPPKFVIARKVLKDVVDSLDNVRMGISHFGPNIGWYDAPVMLHPVKPGCDKSWPMDEGTLRPDVRNQINAMSFQNGERSIGEALFGLGHYYSSEKTDNTWSEWFNLSNFTVPNGFPGRTFTDSSSWNDGNAMFVPNQMPIESGGQQKSVCWSCQESAVIVITDGRPEADNSVPITRMMQLLIANGARHPNGTLVTFDPNAWNNGTCPNTQSVGGINYCNDFGATKCDCDYNGYPSGPQVTNANYMDDVAFFLANMDLREDYTGKQSVRTYTVGFGDNSPMLQSIAKAGNGLFFRADSAMELKAAIIAAVDDIKGRSNAYTGAAVATVQAGSSSATTAAVLPRMLARSSKPWMGRLYRFEQFNEFAQDYNYNDAGVGSDSDKDDIWLLDNSGAIVAEDANGDFMRRNTTTPATPYWEANAVLRADGHASRKIWTVRDTSGDGAFRENDTMIEFSVANWAVLAPYLGVASTPMCPSTTGSAGKMFTKFGLSVAQAITAVNANVSGTITFTAGAATQAQLNELCTKALILWARGADLADENSNGSRTDTRESVLGDIFHSAPVSVDPPAERFLCDLGIVNQCTRTLYSQVTGDVAPTPLRSYPGQNDCSGTPFGARDAYDKYVFDNRKREKLVLVGSNGGMLHAFRNGVASETCASGNSTVAYNSGNGKEAWSFIPPDLLSRLQESVEAHAYFVDGDIMVRDVWADGSGTGGTLHQKEADEYHTLIIGSEGRGGTHYFALEAQWDVSGSATNQPKFLWMYPQPCSREAATFGKTLYALSPKPPPIGPVLIRTSDTTAPDRYGVDAVERWVVTLSGGWSPGRERGRGIYVVDAYSGSVSGRSDNLWWSFEYDEDASGDTLEPRSKLMQSVTAPVALVDYGANAAPGQDGFFDTALFADLNGQVWVARMFAPGEVDATTKQINNWVGARALEMDKNAATTNSITRKQSFFYLTSSVIEPGSNKLLAVLGSGNRYALLEPGPGTCRFDNPLACAKSNCSETKIEYGVEAPKAKIDNVETHWDALKWQHAQQDEAARSQSMCGSAGNVSLKAEFSTYRVASCDLPGNTNDTNPGDVNKRKVECGLDSSGNSYTCTLVSNTDKHGDLMNPTNVDVTNLGTDRFMTFWAYGGTRVMGTTPTPRTFDTGRFDDRVDLTDVTNVGCDLSGCDGGMAEGAAGWVMSYNPIATKTATGSAVLASCALWSTLTPDNSTTGDVCATGASPRSRLYQGDVLTGQPNCAAGFLDGGAYARFQERSVLAPPPEPAATIQISRNGQIRYSAMIVEPGQPQATNVDIAGTQDSLQMVYQLPVSRELHACRHELDGGCAVVP